MGQRVANHEELTNVFSSASGSVGALRRWRLAVAANPPHALERASVDLQFQFGQNLLTAIPQDEGWLGEKSWLLAGSVPHGTGV